MAGFSKVGALKGSANVVEYREGNDLNSSRKFPGQTKSEPSTLERGITHDTEFKQWANNTWNCDSGIGAEVSWKDFRKGVIIEIYSEAVQLALSYKLYRYWVSEHQSVPDLDFSTNAVATQNLKLENEGWGCDYEVSDPIKSSREGEASSTNQNKDLLG